MTLQNKPQDNLPYTETSRFQICSAQYHIRRDNLQEVGVEALYQLQPGILLRVLDLTIRTAQPVTMTAPGKQLIFCFKMAGNNILETTGGARKQLSEGSMLVAYSDTPQIVKDSSDPGEKYLMVMLVCEPDALLQPPFGLEVDQLPVLLQTILHGTSAVSADFTMNAELISALQFLLNSDTADALSRPFLQAKSVEILCLALRNILQQEGQHERSQISERERQQMNEARELLRERWQDPPTQEELVRHLGMGKSHLKKCFKLLFGYSITDYVLRIRMQHAQQLLAEGHMNVSQVAWEVGYEHPCNFVTAFKRQFGLTPKTFQKTSADRLLVSANPLESQD